MTQHPPQLVSTDSIQATSRGGLALRDQFLGFRLVAARQRAEALLGHPPRRTRLAHDETSTRSRGACPPTGGRGKGMILDRRGQRTLRDRGFPRQPAFSRNRMTRREIFARVRQTGRRNFTTLKTYGPRPSHYAILDRDGASYPGVAAPIGVECFAYRRRAGKRVFENKLFQRAAEEQIGRMPDQGETIHMVVSAAYRTVDLVPAWLALKAPEPIQELYIATLSYNRECLDLLLELFDRKQIKAISFVISIYDKANEPARFAYAKEQLQEAVAVSWPCRTIARLSRRCS